MPRPARILILFVTALVLTGQAGCIHASRVKEVNNKTWSLKLDQSDKWFDTKIPVVAGQEIQVFGPNAQYRWAIKLGESRFYNVKYDNSNQTAQELRVKVLETPLQQGEVGLANAPADFKTTLQIRLDPDAKTDKPDLLIKLFDYPCPYDEDKGHVAKHNDARTWASEVMSAIANQ